MLAHDKAHAPRPDAIRALHLDEVGALRPLPPGIDAFGLFALPPVLLLDEGALQEAFYEFSKHFHPDFHANAAPAVRAAALERSAAWNDAYRTLRTLPTRAEYLLARHAPDIKPGKNAVPPSLLESFFDIQEAGEELKLARTNGDAAALAKAEARVAPLRAEALQARDATLAELRTHAGAYDAALAAGNATAMADAYPKLRLALDRLNYLKTVLRNLK